MGNVRSIFDHKRNRVSDALIDENGLPPTSAALDVIMAVIESTDWTDEHHGEKLTGNGPVDIRQYALDAEQKLRLLRKHQ